MTAFHFFIILFIEAVILQYSISDVATEEDLMKNPLYQPTDDELKDYLSVSPYASWGNNIRKEKSIRCICLGGSNTHSNSDSKYPELLHQYLQSSVSNDSYAVNYGCAGTGPSYNMGRTFSFESLPPQKWPNLVTIEYNINCIPTIECIKQIDQVIYSIKSKFTDKNIPIPSFLFLEVMTFNWLYTESKLNDSRDERINGITSNDGDSFNRFFMQDSIIQGLARFYSYPQVSMKNVIYPSFTRFYVENPVITKWIYTLDDTHLNTAGHRMLVNAVIAPFLLDQLNKVKSVKPLKYGKFTEDIRFFPLQTYQESIISRYIGWGVDSSKEMTLSMITSKTTSDWDMIHGNPLKKDINHMCYGSSLAGSVGKLNIPLPSRCSSIISHTSKCMIDVSFVYSWNTSHIGDMTCELLYSNQSNSNTAMYIQVEKKEIVGNVYNKNPVVDTTSKRIAFDTLLSSGEAMLTCKKKDSRVTCITAVTVNIQG